MRKSCVIAVDPVRFAEGDASLDSENFGSKKTRRHDVGGFSLFDVAAAADQRNVRCFMGS
ncbi:hypothetical protein [Xanthomonas arboricola]|uniref:hypothetical protein n=1 Tax=Xanthomonas arboricola TaxID=56448 RepID=UPI0015E31041|nr:hypothetical protein [Xanthomonas arboricola]